MVITGSVEGFAFYPKNVQLTAKGWLFLMKVHLNFLTSLASLFLLDQPETYAHGVLTCRSGQYFNAQSLFFALIAFRVRGFGLFLTNLRAGKEKGQKKTKGQRTNVTSEHIPAWRPLKKMLANPIIRCVQFVCLIGSQWVTWQGGYWKKNSIYFLFKYLCKTNKLHINCKSWWCEVCGIREAGRTLT